MENTAISAKRQPQKKILRKRLAFLKPYEFRVLLRAQAHLDRRRRRTQEAA